VVAEQVALYGTLTGARPRAPKVEASPEARAVPLAPGDEPEEEDAAPGAQVLPMPRRAGGERR